jgi:small subunit ribosomal protein S16
MIKVRLSRRGARNNPFYRIVVVDQKKQTKGKVLGIAGFWFPKKSLLNLKKEIIAEWLKKGAKLTSAVSKIINNQNPK